MKVGIHQPHYFPWAGYLNKIYSTDIFVILDEVQLEKGSYMYRNRILNDKGQIKYLTISADKHGFLNKSFCDIKTINDEEFLQKQREEIVRSYKKAEHFDEVWTKIEDLFVEKEDTICDYCLRSIFRLVEILDIKTNIVLQSEIKLDALYKKNELVLNICKALNADEYLSGIGARKYNDESRYKEEGIMLSYQSYSMPEYRQINTGEFTSGLSIIDTLFNCGIEGSKAIIRGQTV